MAGEECAYRLLPSVGTWFSLRIEPASSGPEVASQMLGRPYFQNPSVGTWLLASGPEVGSEREQAEIERHTGLTFDLKPPVGLIATALAQEAEEDQEDHVHDSTVFFLRPSVGTWFYPLLAEKSERKEVTQTGSLELPKVPSWHADFDSFGNGAANGISPTPSTPAADRTHPATMSRGSSGSMFRLAPPPTLSTGTPVGTRASVEEVVVLRSLRDEGIVPPASVELGAQHVPMNTTYDENDELLVHEERKADGLHKVQRIRNDGLDSSSEPDSEMREAEPASSAAMSGGRGPQETSRPIQADAPVHASAPSTQLPVESCLASAPQRPPERSRLMSLDTGQDQSPRQFRVQVPKPYPGLQYRTSKNLQDRYNSHVEDGAIVVGVLEDNGEWLRLENNLFLPVKVRGSRMLRPLDESGMDSCASVSGVRTAQTGMGRPSQPNPWWWLLCSGCRGETTTVSADGDLLVDLGGRQDSASREEILRNGP